MATTILIGDATEQLATLPAGSVHCCVTSPPYFGLRDYGVAGQIGLESRVEDYVSRLVAVFREVKRVLRDDGTLWLNLGDSYYATGWECRGVNSVGNGSMAPDERRSSVSRILGFTAKQLLGIPWRVAFALQSDGWILRQDIIWHKPNPMPESVRDRCTKSHEYMFLFAKQPRYYFDHVAMQEDGVTPPGIKRQKQKYADAHDAGAETHRTKVGLREVYLTGKRNRRSVWRISTRSYKGAHFAVFPPDLVEPCILAGTSEFGCCSGCGTPFQRIVERTRVPTRLGTDSTKSPDPQRHVTTTVTKGFDAGCKCVDTSRVNCTVLDPFGGSGTTAQVAKKHGRDCVLIELNPAYRPLIEARIGGAA